MRALAPQTRLPETPNEAPWIRPASSVEIIGPTGAAAPVTILGASGFAYHVSLLRLLDCFCKHSFCSATNFTLAF